MQQKNRRKITQQKTIRAQERQKNTREGIRGEGNTRKRRRRAKRCRRASIKKNMIVKREIEKAERKQQMRRAKIENRSTVFSDIDSA